MNQAIIKLDNKKFILKQSFRALMLFEKMTGRNSFEINASMNDSMSIFYCMLKAANKEIFNYSFDEFMDLVDEQPEVLTELQKYMTSIAQDTAVADKKKAETR